MMNFSLILSVFAALSIMASTGTTSPISQVEPAGVTHLDAFFQAM